MKRFKISKYQLLAYLYFFFNNAGLAGGLLYTNLLTPFFYFWLIIKKKRPILFPYLAIIVPFNLIHLLNGTEWKSFLISNFLLLSTYIFVVSFHYFIHHYEKLEDLFYKLLLANFIFTIIACFVYFTPFKELLWYKNKFTESVENFYRLSLLTFEASYYSLLFAPIAIYYLLLVFFKQNKQRGIIYILLVCIPLLLSLSLGVLGALLISFAVLYLIHFKLLFYKKNFFNVLVGSAFLLIIVFFIMLLFFPTNPIFVRLSNIYYGLDSSTRGRTSDSFGMSWKVAGEKSIWFGAGLGQIKILAYDIVKKYYAYWGELETVRIPNSVAETLAIFGIWGLVIRFTLIGYFFLKTKVLNNYFRTCLFAFIFVYQFTGSYFTNIVEYVIWVLAFSSLFKRFDLDTKFKESKGS